MIKQTAVLQNDGNSVTIRWKKPKFNPLWYDYSDSRCFSTKPAGRYGIEINGTLEYTEHETYLNLKNTSSYSECIIVLKAVYNRGTMDKGIVFHVQIIPPRNKGITFEGQIIPPQTNISKTNFVFPN